MIEFKKARFTISAPSSSSLPKDGIPCVLMVGRTNVGKSTLLNSLTGQRLAYSSKKPGKTKLLNCFLIDEKMYLIDAPGYGSTGYATMSTIHFATMMEECLRLPSIKAVCLLLDLRREPGEDDRKFVAWLSSSKKPVIAILTKVDTMNQSELSAAKKRAESLGLTQYLLSDNSAKTLEKIRVVIAHYAK